MLGLGKIHRAPSDMGVKNTFIHLVADEEIDCDEFPRQSWRRQISEPMPSIARSPLNVQAKPAELTFMMPTCEEVGDSDTLSSSEPEPEEFCRQVTETQWPTWHTPSMDSLDSIEPTVAPSIDSLPSVTGNTPSMDSLPSIGEPQRVPAMTSLPSMAAPSGMWPVMQQPVISPLQYQLAQAALNVVAGYGTDEQPAQWTMEPERLKKKKNNRRKERSMIGRANAELLEQQREKSQQAVALVTANAANPVAEASAGPAAPPPPPPAPPAEAVAVQAPPQPPAQSVKPMVSKFCHACGGATGETCKFCRFCGVAVLKFA